MTREPRISKRAAGDSSERRLGLRPPPRGPILGLLLAILLLGALMRFQAAPSKFGPHEHAAGDVQRYYVSVADSLLDGRGWTTDYEWNFIPPPGQAVFLALAKASFPGADFGTLRYLQAVLSVLTIPLAFWIGWRMEGAWTGLFAAALVAADRNLVEYVATLLAENNYFLFLFLFLALLLEAERRRSIALSAWAGCALATASLFKPFPMFLALLLPLYLVARHRDRRALLQGGALFLGFALLVAPWTARNYARYGRPYLISTNGGTLLAQSNFLRLDPTDDDQIYWESIYRGSAWKSDEIEQRFAGRTDRYGRPEWNEKDRAYLRYALRYILRHPRHFLRNYVVKLYNVLVYPLPARGERWFPSHYFRVGLLLLSLPGLVWFAIAERRAPPWILVPVAFYFLAFSALLHLLRSGRMNLPVKVILGFFAAYLLARGARWIVRRTRG